MNHARYNSFTRFQTLGTHARGVKLRLRRRVIYCYTAVRTRNIRASAEINLRHFRRIAHLVDGELRHHTCGIIDIRPADRARGHPTHVQIPMQHARPNGYQGRVRAVNILRFNNRVFKVMNIIGRLRLVTRPLGKYTYRGRHAFRHVIRFTDQTTNSNNRRTIF